MGLQRWAGSCETLDATKRFLHTGDPPEYLRRAWIWVGRGSLWPQASPGGGCRRQQGWGVCWTLQLSPWPLDSKAGGLPSTLRGFCSQECSPEGTAQS